MNLDDLIYRNTFTINPRPERIKNKSKNKKWKREDLLKELRKLIKKIDVTEVNRESFSDYLLADIGMIDWCFMKLNKEGLLRKDDIETPDCEGWRPNWYRINKQK